MAMVRKSTGEQIRELMAQRSPGERLALRECVVEGGNLAGCDLRNVDFGLSRFEGVDLSGADFSGSSLNGVLFADCPMRGCRFLGTDMREAIFRYIDLSGSDISGADLYAAVLEFANLEGIRSDEETRWFRMVPPEEGAFIAWKCCTELRVVQLLVPADARRVSATRETCRCDKAKVLSIKSVDESVSYDWAQSTVDPDFYYERGKWVEPSNGFEADRWQDSSRGIHFFMEREQCVAYQMR